jgi:hypothetical protein
MIFAVICSTDRTCVCQRKGLPFKRVKRGTITFVYSKTRSPFACFELIGIKGRINYLPALQIGMCENKIVHKLHLGTSIYPNTQSQCQPGENHIRNSFRKLLRWTSTPLPSFWGVNHDIASLRAMMRTRR